MSVRRGGIPGPESRTGLVRPSMSEAEFERRLGGAPAAVREAGEAVAEAEPGEAAPSTTPEPEPNGRATASGGSSRSRARRQPPAKIRRVQRMFAIEEELDKKLWLYAIHVGKDRSDVVNDLLRPVVASMVLYDSRDRRNSGRQSDPDGQEGQGGD